MTDERLSTADLVRDDSDAPVARDPDAEAAPGERTALEPLFEPARVAELRERWHRLQADFVDDPREAVATADTLVGELLQELARGFSEARSGLERQWSQGDDVSTDHLRVTLQRYRSFFERLLAA